MTVDEQPVHDSTESIIKKYRGIINKLTCENSEKLFEDLVNLIQSSPQCITSFADELFDKVCDDAEYAPVYATLSAYIRNPARFDNVQAFLHRFINQFQSVFNNRLESDNRNRTSTTINFLGHLFRMKVINEAVFHQCLQDLLRTKENSTVSDHRRMDLVEMDLTYFCKLMEMNGELLDQSNAGQQLLNQYMKRVSSLLHRYKIQPRVRFAFQNLEERRTNNWVGRKAKATDVVTSLKEPLARVSNGRQPSGFVASVQPKINGFSGDSRHSFRGIDSNHDLGQWKGNQGAAGKTLMDNTRRDSQRQFAPTILKRGMEHDFLNVLVENGKEETQNAKSNQKSETSFETELDREIEAFLTNPERKFSSAINNIKKTVFAHGNPAYLIYATIKHSLSFGDSSIKPTAMLLKELFNANVFDSSACDEGMIRIMSELPHLEKIYSCVKSHVAMLISQLYVANALNITKLVKVICSSQQSIDLPDQSDDSIMQSLLIIMQNISQQENIPRKLTDILIDCIKVEPDWLRRFDQWTKDCPQLSIILANRGLNILQPLICPRQIIDAHIRNCVSDSCDTVNDIFRIPDITKSDPFLTIFFDCLYNYVTSETSISVDTIKKIVQSTIDERSNCMGVLDRIAKSTQEHLFIQSLNLIRDACSIIDAKYKE